MRKSLIILSVLFIASFIAWRIDSNRVEKLEESNKWLSYWDSVHTSDAELSSKIANKSWYVVNDTTISSEPDGKGEIVVLPEIIKSKRIGLDIIRATKNTQVTFQSMSYGKKCDRITDQLSYTFENEASVRATQLALNNSHK